MKIAIKANPSRGKEIISLLKSLGSNTTHLSGDGRTYSYYMDENHLVRYGDPPIDYKVYTLEEFEKEFPFKIGDKVTIVGLPDFPKVITQMMWDCDEILYSFEGLNNTWFDAKALKKFEMKEERNITLTLEKAKEWYNKGGELKEIALQAFSEKELNPLPKSWEEFSCKYKICSTRYAMPSKYAALYQLEKLRDCYRGLFVTVIGMPIWNINIYDRKPRIFQAMWGKNHSFLSFKSREVAEEYLKNFKPLIEQAGDLI